MEFLYERILQCFDLLDISFLFAFIEVIFCVKLIIKFLKTYFLDANEPLNTSKHKVHFFSSSRFFIGYGFFEIFMRNFE